MQLLGIIATDVLFGGSQNICFTGSDVCRTSARQIVKYDGLQNDSCCSMTNAKSRPQQRETQMRKYYVVVQKMREMEGVADVLWLWYVKEFGSYNSWMILGGNYIVSSRVTLSDSSGGKSWNSFWCDIWELFECAVASMLLVPVCVSLGQTLVIQKKIELSLRVSPKSYKSRTQVPWCAVL